MRIWIILLLIGGLVNARRKVYTEEDEAKYLQELKEQELRSFEMEMKHQSSLRGGKYSGSQLGVELSGGGGYDSTELPSELRGPPTKKKVHHQRDKVQAQALTLQKENEPFSPKTLDTVVDDTDDEDHWCYYCATPIDKVKPEMRKSIRNLLEMRRTAFPVDAVTPECLSARNLTKLKKQKCSYKYCQTLSIVDRNAGNAFVVRGCAEHFGAINVKELEKKNDHSCQMLHEKLEIKECICKTSKYCHAGWTKRSASDSYQTKWSILSIFITLFVLYH